MQRFGTWAIAIVLGANISASANAVRHALEARYQHARTLKAEFYERYSDGSGGVAAESGVVYFSRPGRMRWEYESPEQKLFLVDGKNAWFYVPVDHTASRAKMGPYVAPRWLTALAVATAALIIVLNVKLVLDYLSRGE